MIDGHGDPNSSPDFTQAVESLYPVAYKLKFGSRATTGRDYVVPPLEGLWWAEDLDAFTTARDKSQWDWTMMLLVPEWIDEDQVLAAKEQAAAKNRPARLDDVRFEALAEGLCVQTLHLGSFDDEAPVLDRLHHEFVPAEGLALRGKHHEIYLSDFRGPPRRSSAPSSASRWSACGTDSAPRLIQPRVSAVQPLAGVPPSAGASGSVTGAALRWSRR